MSEVSHASLKRPWLRAELLDILRELSADDPLIVWQSRRQEGHLSGVTQIVHFLFDDNDFGEAGIGVSLLNGAEVSKIAEVKGALDAVIDERSPGDDQGYITHSCWPRVRMAALAALDLTSRG